MNTRFLKALCAGLATVVLASPGAVAGLSLQMTNTVTVTTTSAVVRVSVTSNDAAGAYVWLYWGLTNNGNNATWPNTNAIGTVTNSAVQSVSLSGLTAGTTYWATTYATNGTTNAWATWQTNWTTAVSLSSTGMAVTAYPDGTLRTPPTNFFDVNGPGTPTVVRLASLESGVLGLTNAIGAATNRITVLETGTSRWESAYVAATGWLASVAYGITAGMTNEWTQGYVAGTNWLASAAATITAGMVSDWNASTNWLASVAYSITGNDTNNWTSAWSWGNHASIGYHTNGFPDPVFLGTTTVTNLVVNGVQTNNGSLTVHGTADLAGVKYGGTNAALWCVTETNAWLDIGTNRIFLTP